MPSAIILNKYVISYHKMKRFLVLILATLYFAVSSGFTVHVHYCMGHIVETTLVSEDGDTHHCDHCGMKKKKGGNGCCKEEAKIVKHTVDHSLVKQLQIPVQELFIVPAVSFLPAPAIAFQAQQSRQSFQAHAPPDPFPCPIYIAIRNLSI